MRRHPGNLSRLSALRLCTPTGRQEPAEDSMFKFLGGTIGVIFLIGLLVVIGLLSLIF
jgi:hypothetical protein